ncbi:brain mitochondrial carrier protein 1 isoform X2 [Terrapene carolina triunguis]|uniref:brain mitochondrial carrier protein 1 isoform X2 n=1 Tax=Terrapene triunguis TaxID=2587831 RepID=UPI000CEFCD06|nr:brain mitochondrial carrier protein 1 isoform X2 [Terrapene carolina triunguis]
MSVLNWKPFVYGGLASLVAEFGTFPVDLTKTRLQVQGQSIDARFQEIKIAPALLRQASYGTIKIGIYQSLKRLFVDRLEDETLLINMICGVVSGVISSTLANPTDVLKIRMQAQGSLFQGGMIGSFIDIYQQEGTRGLWRGVVPTAQRAAIVVGVELPVYDITKKHLILSGFMGDTILAHFVSSFTCGLAGAIASNPVDVVRTRMMNQRAIVGSVELYKGTLDGLVKVRSQIVLGKWGHSHQGPVEPEQVLMSHVTLIPAAKGTNHGAFFSGNVLQCNKHGLELSPGPAPVKWDSGSCGRDSQSRDSPRSYS